MGLIIGGASARDLILDGQSVSLYVGGTPPTKVWPTWETVQITLGSGFAARDQLRAALSDRGLDYGTVTEIPFDIELVGTGSAENMFRDCASLTHAPEMDTSSVTNMRNMFRGCASLTHVPEMDTSSVVNMMEMFRDCASLTHVPEMDTSSVVNMYFMFYNCSSLTSVPAMDTSSVTNMYAMLYNCSSLTSVPAMDTSSVTTMYAMLYNCSSLTSVPAMDTSSVTNMEYMFQGCAALTSVPDMDTSQVTNMLRMFFNCSSLTDGNVRLIGKHPNVTTSDMITNSGLTREPFYTTDGQPWPTAEVYEVSLTDVQGVETIHPLLTVTVPAGETWSVRIQGTVTEAASVAFLQPLFRIGVADSGKYGQGAAVDFSGTVTAANSTIALVTNTSAGTGFTGTVTIEK